MSATTPLINSDQINQNQATIQNPFITRRPNNITRIQSCSPALKTIAKAIGCVALSILGLAVAVVAGTFIAKGILVGFAVTFLIGGLCAAFYGADKVYDYFMRSRNSH